MGPRDQKGIFGTLSMILYHEPEDRLIVLVRVEDWKDLGSSGM